MTNPYTYTGREIDVESGLYYYRARYYDPMIGRFLTEDPFDIRARQHAPLIIRNDFNSIEKIRPWLTKPKEQNNFLYTVNNPINFNDPVGLDDPVNDPSYKACIKELHLLELECINKKAYDPKCWIKVKLKSEECGLIALKFIKKRPYENRGPTPECPQDTYQLPTGI